MGRPSRHQTPTLEFRIADACATVDEAVMHVGLCRALAQVCLDEVASGHALPEIRAELLGAARWLAAGQGSTTTWSTCWR
ncbi:MAG: hypothetical protein ACRDRP_24400 [Pseudonocardiaceae bacterium]